MSVVTTMVGLIVALVCLVASELHAAARACHENADSLLRLVSVPSADALASGSAAAAGTALAALGTDATVIAVTLRTPDGREFARYRSPLPAHAAALAALEARHAGRSGADVAPDDGPRSLPALLAEPFLEIARPVGPGERLLGSIEAYFDVSSLAGLARERTLTALGVLLAASALAWLLATRLRQLIAAPIEELAGRIRRVTETRDYSLRATPAGRNEIGTLSAGFNGILDQLQTRDARLRIARDCADEASRAKSMFLATVSHEIRTPMNGVIGMAELLAFTRLDDEQQHLLRHIRNSADGLMRVINDILDFSKLEAGRMTVEAIHCSPREIVEDIAAFYQFQARDKGLMIRCQIAGDLPPVIEADPIRLRQILANLIANALKFSTVGEITVSLDHRPLDGPDGPQALLHFNVLDRGIGIDPAVLPRLFTPFTQADNSYARRFGGTGLGLAICQQLVALMGGEIGVDSRPGEGSNFWFTLTAPVRDAAPASAGPQRHPLDTRAGNAGLTGLRVLVADDDGINQMLTTLQLEQFHCEVTTASNGAEVLALLARRPFDVILMDGQMPVLDGYETTRRIRQAEQAGGDTGPRIPIIAVTGNAGDDERAAARACGMDDLIVKPYSPATLRDALVHHVVARSAVSGAR